MASQYIYTMVNLRKVVPPQREILKPISPSSFPGAKIGVLGLNGAGKSSLLRIMAGVDTEFNGEAFAADGTRVGFLAQDPWLDPAKNVLENVEAAVAPVKKLLARFDELGEKMGESLSDDEMEKVMAEYGRVQDAIEAANGWDLDRTLETAMDALRCPPPDSDVTKISGGERRRVALCRVLLEKPDLLLLDLMLPHIPGTEICKTIKADPALRNTQVVMLTAQGEEIDRVVGFELGADDYVVKPFSVRELLLRVQAILRRSQGEQEVAPGFQFGSLRVDREAHRVWAKDEELELTALEFKLLVTLFDRKNRVQTRAALLSDVWGIDADITTRTVDTHVKRLREKLGEAGVYIETVRGVGYRFADNPEEAAG